MSAILAIKQAGGNVRPKLIDDILNAVSQLSNLNTYITFYWVPAHCGIFYNEKVDALAKKGAMNSLNTVKIDLAMDYHEYCTILKKVVKNKVYSNLKNSTLSYSINCIKPTTDTSGFMFKQVKNLYCRKIHTLMFRLRLNSYRVKYIKNQICLCGAIISTKHLCLHCPLIISHINLYYKEKLNDCSALSLSDILNNQNILSIFASVISVTCFSHLI